MRHRKVRGDFGSHCDQAIKSTKFGMSKPAEVNLGDRIRIEAGDTAISALVTLILEASCEALYIDDAGKVLAEEVQWLDGAWRFVHLTPVGIDAEASSRLRPFIMKLRGKSK